MAPIVPIIPINRIKGVWTEGDVVLKNPIVNFVDSRLILNFEKQDPIAHCALRIINYKLDLTPWIENLA